MWEGNYLWHLITAQQLLLLQKSTSHDRSLPISIQRAHVSMVQSESVMWSTNVTDIILGLIDYLWLQHDQASSGLIGCVCISFCHLWKAAGFRFPNPITRIIVGYVCVGKQWLCSDFTFILVQLLMVSCHNSVVNGLVRLRHKKHFRVTKTFCWSWRCSNIIFFFWHKHGWRLLKNIQ